MHEFTREDFEMAAKAAIAAGIGLSQTGIGVGVDYKVYFLNKKTQTVWAPQHDDGESLELAIKLNMTLGLDHEFGIPHVDGVSFIREDDMEKATRHAIFRRAIDIGRAMP